MNATNEASVPFWTPTRMLKAREGELHEAMARVLRFRNIYRLPGAVHSFADLAYRAGKLWQHDTLLERTFRLLRRPVVVPKLNAAIAQNALLGVAIRPTAEVGEVWESLENWIETIRPSDDPLSRVPLADLGVLCANVFAHKNYSQFTDSGVNVLYPFLSFPMVDLAIRRSRYWPTANQGKEVLRELFGRDVPEGSLATRPKTGFVAENRSMFRSPAFLERIEQATTTDAPLAAMLDLAFFTDMIRLVRSGRRLPANIYNLAWAVVMTDSWLRNTRDGLAPRGARGAKRVLA